VLGVGSRSFAAIAIAVIIAACGSSAGAPSGTPGAGSTSTSSIGAQQHQESLRFARCVRAHGVPHFPDPPDDGSYGVKSFAEQPGGKTISVAGVSVGAPAFRSAMTRCSGYLPLQAAPTTSQLSKIRALTVRWAKCIRAHGLPHFGDPTITADGHRIMHGQFAIGSPAYYAARNACDPKLNRSMAATGLGALAPS
jgi:hypothetical protein